MLWSQDCGGAQRWAPWENEAPLQEIKGEGKSLASLGGHPRVLHDAGPVSTLPVWNHLLAGKLSMWLKVIAFSSVEQNCLGLP